MFRTMYSEVEEMKYGIASYVKKNVITDSMYLIAESIKFLDTRQHESNL